jgi:hypothetical protein
MYGSYVERFKVNFNLKRFKLNVQRFKVNIQRFKVNLKRFKVTDAAAGRQNLSVSVHFHHVVGISIIYHRDSISMEILNQPPPTATSPPAPNPKQRQFGSQQQSMLSYPLLSQLKGKGGTRNQLHLKALIAILPSPTAKKSWYVLGLRCTAKCRRCCNDIVAAATTGDDGQRQEHAKPAIPTFVLPQSCTNLTVHIVLYILLCSKKASIEYVYKTRQKVMGCTSMRLLASCSRFCPKTSAFVVCLVFPQNLQKLPGS